MINPYKKNAKLVLSNGIVFPGFFFGASGTAFGEVVFNTGMTGYQEVITDPSYYGQILTFTYPEIGNTGINLEDSESSISVKGIIVRNYSSNNSNWRSLKNFNQWLVEKNIVGLHGIDTRALVKILRSNGSMNGVITSEDKTVESCLKIIHDAPKMEGLNLSKIVSTNGQYLWKSHTQTIFDLRKRYDKTSKKLKIVAIDFGIKNSILYRLVSHGCEVLVLPSQSSLKDVLSYKPDGIFFSNGPGDPSSVSEGIDLAKSLIEYGEIPMFGICLGHQIFGLALGGSTYKLPFGHRGLNHPCGKNNKIEIISIMFEMKNESLNGTNKRKNEDFLKELDKDRRQKSCEYAVLVSLLEPESELYNAGIVDVSYRFPKMYVIRPQFFLPIISLLRNASMETLKYKSQIDLMKRENYDITNFESTLEQFKNAVGKNVSLAQDRFNDAISEIDKSITHLQKTKEALILSKKHLLSADSKSQDLTVKKLTRNNPTMKKKFNDLNNFEDEVA